MTYRFRMAAAALVVTMPFSRSRAQHLSKDVVAARVDSMARAYMAAKGPASMSVAITRGSDTLVQRAWGLADVAANRAVTVAGTYSIATWNRALHGGRALSPASYAAMTTARGPAPKYGFGLQVQTLPWGAPVLYHLGSVMGSVMGFAAENAWFPAESLSVTVLYNSFGPKNGFPTNFILEIARAVSHFRSTP